MKKIAVLSLALFSVFITVQVEKSFSLIDPNTYIDECIGSHCGAPPTGGMGGGGAGGVFVLVTYNLGPYMFESDDFDDDGVMDADDNCIGIANDQTDSDGDGIGDACDNCVNNPNPDQSANVDGDEFGDICDSDIDGDGIHVDGSESDNCPYIVNSSQRNSDTDTMGDAVDSDDDNDGTPDTLDDCPLSANNTDCADSDGDDYINTVDLCPNCKSDFNTDEDGDLVGDACDNCPRDINPDQTDTDRDGRGDACDS